MKTIRFLYGCMLLFVVLGNGATWYASVEFRDPDWLALSFTVMAIYLWLHDFGNKQDETP